MDGDGGLLVRGGLGGDPLHPEARSGKRRQEGTAAPGGEPDQFVAQSDQQGQQRNAAQELRQKAIKRDECINGNRQEKQHEQETRAAARMEGRKALRGGHCDGLPRFEIEYHFVLRTVVFKGSMDVLDTRNTVEQSQQDADPEDSIREVKRNAPGNQGPDSC